MLIFVPVMFVTTLAMTLLFMATLTHEELAVDKTVARDFEMVHEWRVELAQGEDITDGAIEALPGYPFQPFYDYYTEVYETDLYIAIATWPAGENGTVALPEQGDSRLLATIDARLRKGSYAGNFEALPDGPGGRLASFEMTGLDRFPDDGMPTLLKVIIKEDTPS